MGNYNLGSFSADLLIFIDSIPVAMSGTPLNNLVERAIATVDNELGTSIGSVNVDIKYQDAIFNLSAASVLKSLNVQGTIGTTSTLGPMTIGMGGDSNAVKSAQEYEKRAREALNQLKRPAFVKIVG